ncbi:MAG: sodium ABC transporter ATP-binding protein [Candidatus Aminicenantes bacterium RBG_13_63_10]|nr:MAG: sodium ABC transporter ATP-binding protein [Candidatus Aminicenantes bacterium RBG_13_63_10]
MNNALEIRNLTKDYGDFLLDDVSFSLPPGTIMGLIGPNGAGKTTVIKLILNLLRRDGGEIKVFGLDNRSDEVEVKSRVGFVHDTPYFYERLRLTTIKDTVAPFYRDWDEPLFRKLLAEFDLPPRKSLVRLSRGMKMKFALALALSHRAELIILDEPTSGLDPVFRRELLGRLSALIQDEKTSVLFSTHITSDLERIADYITFLHKGRVVFSSPKDDILDRWAVVKAGRDLLTDDDRRFFRGFREREYGFEGLTSDAAAARRRFGDKAVIEKAALEDIMFYLTRGAKNV